MLDGNGRNINVRQRNREPAVSYREGEIVAVAACNCKIK